MFRHLEAVIHECGLEDEHFPYISPTSLSDSNNLTRVTVVALSDIADINLHNVLLPAAKCDNHSHARPCEAPALS